MWLHKRAALVQIASEGSACVRRMRIVSVLKIQEAWV